MRGRKGEIISEVTGSTFNFLTLNLSFQTLAPVALLVALERIQVLVLLVLLTALPAALESFLPIQLLQMRLQPAQIAKLERCVLFVKDNRTHTLHILC